MRRNIKSNSSQSQSILPKQAGPRPEDYQVVLHWSVEDSCYIATLPAWQNVQTHGESIEQASRNAHEVLGMLIETAKKKGEAYPAPHMAYSGNLRLRLPSSLHERLAREAEREGVSLNQWLVAKLAS